MSNTKKSRIMLKPIFLVHPTVLVCLSGGITGHPIFFSTLDLHFFGGHDTWFYFIKAHVWGILLQTKSQYQIINSSTTLAYLRVSLVQWKGQLFELFDQWSKRARENKLHKDVQTEFGFLRFEARCLLTRCLLTRRLLTRCLLTHCLLTRCLITRCLITRCRIVSEMYRVKIFFKLIKQMILPPGKRINYINEAPNKDRNERLELFM